MVLMTRLESGGYLVYDTFECDVMDVVEHNIIDKRERGNISKRYSFNSHNFSEKDDCIICKFISNHITSVTYISWSDVGMSMREVNERSCWIKRSV